MKQEIIIKKIETLKQDKTINHIKYNYWKWIYQYI